jgi:hypothetical protein
MADCSTHAERVARGIACVGTSEPPREDFREAGLRHALLDALEEVDVQPSERVDVTLLLNMRTVVHLPGAATGERDAVAPTPVVGAR